MKTPKTDAFVTGNSEPTGDEYAELAELCRTLEREATVTKKLFEWLGEETQKSRTGISFDWAPFCEGDPSGFMFMRHHFLGERKQTIEQAIHSAMKARMGAEAATKYLDTP